MTDHGRVARCLTCGRRFNAASISDKCCSASCYDEWLAALAAAGPLDPERERAHAAIREWAWQRERAQD